MTKPCLTDFSAQRKELLEHSLLALMETVPYRDITVKDICQKAGIPRRTFYHYFGSKEDALDSLVESMMLQCYLDILFDVHQRVERMQHSFIRVFQFWEGDNRRKLDLLMKNGLESQLLAHAMKWVRSEDIGIFQYGTMDPKTLDIGIMVGITGFFSLLFHWSRGGYRESPEEMAAYAVKVMPQAFFSS